MPRVEVIRTYLEMTDPARLRRAPSPDPEARVVRVERCPASFYRYLYTEVGRAYLWLDRADWTDDQIRTHLSRPEVSLWVLYRGGAPAGYFELVEHPDASVEVAYFGLLPEAVGAGLGKFLLSVATDEAWSRGATRVWLHTCTLDGPAALPNYLARGFESVRTETYLIEKP